MATRAARRAGLSLRCGLGRSTNNCPLGACRSAGWQAYPRIAEILGRYGIPIVRTVTGVGEGAVVAEAERLGFPVAVKAGDPQLVHKSDVGAV